METFNDIVTDLPEDVDMQYLRVSPELEAKKGNKAVCTDLSNSLKKNILVPCRKYFKVFKLKTKNFDSLIRNKKLKDIDIHLPSTSQKKPVLISSKQHNFKGTTKKIPSFSIDILKKGKNEAISFIKGIGFGIPQKNTVFKKVSFSILLFIVLVGIDAFGVQFFVQHGYTKLTQVKDSISQVEKNQSYIRSARISFIVSKFLFTPFRVFPGQDIQNIDAFIQGGKTISDLLDEAYIYYNSLHQYLTYHQNESIYLTNILKNSHLEFETFSDFLYQSILAYQKIDNIGNKTLQKKLDDTLGKLRYAYNFMIIINRNFDTFLNLLGDNQEKNYLVLLQNNDEIRATGGFIGSIAMLSIYKGQVKDIHLEDIYSYEWDINKAYTKKIPAPEGINKMTKHLGIRDANYEINFSDSSQQIKFFLDKINKKVDGIIYINQNIILDLLKQTGNINFLTSIRDKQTFESINEKNFSLLLSTLVEAKVSKVGTLGTPKQILFDFAQKFIQTLKEKQKYALYAQIFFDAVQQRDIVMTSFIPEENSLLWKLNLNGDISYFDTLDYSYPVYTSIGGGKTDRYYQRQYTKTISTNPDCSINTSFEVIGKHNFTQADEDMTSKILEKYDIKDPNILFIQGKTDNKSYVRILLPLEAKIKKEAFFTLKKYKNSQMVEFYTQTKRGETSHYKIDYMLPNPNCHPYTFALYKQSGIRQYDVEINEDGKVKKTNGIKGDYLYNQQK